ncbi:hypothetical protein FJK96_09220 [Mycobacteroides chelonae]|uniref:Uncharacterized protein n=1 Tax=Mycobacteroides chelonae TaxID=1774 RepID=A0AB73U097_MYCCH|nr:hypothetical protein FJK96_09220 [Mycobacteroides chelonae]
MRWGRRNRAMARRRNARPHRSMSYLSSGTRTPARLGAAGLGGKGIFLPGQGVARSMLPCRPMQRRRSQRVNLTMRREKLMPRPLRTRRIRCRSFAPSSP